MGKRLLTTAIALIAIVCPVFINAEAYIQIDKKLAMEVNINTGGALTLEIPRTVAVTNQRETQDSVLSNVSRLASYRELFTLTLNNAKLIGVESGIYKLIYARCLEIATLTPQILSKLNSAKMGFVVITEVSNLIGDATSLANAFSNIVTNGKLELPIGQRKSGTDGINYIKPINRLAMAQTIYSQLDAIKCRLQSIIWAAEFLTVHRALRIIDPEGWYNMVATDISMQIVLQQWNKLKKPL